MIPSDNNPDSSDNTIFLFSNFVIMCERHPETLSSSSASISVIFALRLMQER